RAPPVHALSLPAALPISQLLRLLQLAAGIRAYDQIVQLAAHARQDAAALFLNHRLRLAALQLRQRAGEQEGLAAERAIHRLRRPDRKSTRLNSSHVKTTY